MQQQEITLQSSSKEKEEKKCGLLHFANMILNSYKTDCTRRIKKHKHEGRKKKNESEIKLITLKSKK